MKKMILLIIVAMSFATIYGQTVPLKAVVDERTELMSTLFRLAEAREYVSEELPEYLAEIDSFFAPVKDHDIIKFIHELRKTRGVSYDAVMNYAIHLNIKDNISFIENLEENTMDSRWGKENAEKFLILLNDFYQKSNFRQFYQDHESIRKIAENNFQIVLNNVHFDWFDQFFGTKSDGNFNLIISLINGGNNYGANLRYKDGKEAIFSIIGTWATDSLGNPTYDSNILSIIIHEFNHSYCNPLVEQFIEELHPQSEKFYKLVSEKMQQQAYGNSTTMLYEMLVRACVFQYSKKDASDQKINMELRYNQNMGYLWIDKLYNLLNEYQKNRAQYPTLKDFMPEIVKLQNALNPKKIKEEFDSYCGKFISTSIKNKAKNIDPNTKQITVTFSHPMNTGNNGCSYGKKGKEFFPEFSEEIAAIWNKDSKKWTLNVILKPNTEYSLCFPGQFFLTKEGYPVVGNYYLDFKTGK